MDTEIGFRLVGGDEALIVLPVRVNEDGPFDFVLDTGASMSLASPEVAGQSGVEVSESVEGVGAGGRISVSLGRLRSMSVGQAKRENVEVAVTDELAAIGAAVGASLDGVVGYNFLKAYSVEIDYRARRLRLREGGDSSSARTNVEFEVVSDIKPLVMVPATVNGRGPYRFAVDTGASATVLCSETAKDLGIESAEATAVTGGGGQASVRLGSAQSLAVGNAELRNLPVLTADFLSTLSLVVGHKLDGIIGYNFLKEFGVVIDYPNGLLGFEHM